MDFYESVVSSGCYLCRCGRYILFDSLLAYSCYQRMFLGLNMLLDALLLIKATGVTGLESGQWSSKCHFNRHRHEISVVAGNWRPDQDHAC